MFCHTCGALALPRILRFEAGFDIDHRPILIAHRERWCNGCGSVVVTAERCARSLVELAAVGGSALAINARAALEEVELTR